MRYALKHNTYKKDATTYFEAESDAAAERWVEDNFDADFDGPMELFKLASLVEWS